MVAAHSLQRCYQQWLYSGEWVYYFQRAILLRPLQGSFFVCQNSMKMDKLFNGSGCARKIYLIKKNQ